MKGFTLIEILIYLALTSLILTGSLSTTFYVFNTAYKAQEIIDQTEELNAFYNLMSWVINDASVISPLPYQSTQEVVINKNGSLVKIYLENNCIYMQIDSTSPVSLTTENNITELRAENLASNIFFSIHTPNSKFVFALP